MTAAPGTSLSQRVEAFLKTLGGFENVDALLKERDVPGKKRADYLLRDRSIIIEQKILVADPAGKPQKFVDNLVQDGKAIFFGTVSTALIFRKMADGEQQRKRMFDHLARVVIDDIENADKQTRDTRELFSIADAMGIVLILNEGAKTLEPDIVRYGIQRAYMKRDQVGKRRFTQNVGVIAMSEIHTVDFHAAAKTHPVLSFIDQESPHAEAFETFSREFQQRWAAFNGVPLYWASHADFAKAK
jgi:hypothetical protein